MASYSCKWQLPAAGYRAPAAGNVTVGNITVGIVKVGIVKVGIVTV